MLVYLNPFHSFELLQSTVFYLGLQILKKTVHVILYTAFFHFTYVVTVSPPLYIFFRKHYFNNFTVFQDVNIL